MAKIPDFGGFTKKLDIQGLMDTVKSAVSGVGPGPAKVPGNDEIAAKFADVVTAIQTLANANGEQAKLISTLSSKINSLQKDLQAIKGAEAAAAAAPPPAATPEVTPSETPPGEEEKK